MNLGEIYTYINAIIAKEVEGNTFNPVTFNAVINAVNLEAFRQEFDFLEQQAKGQGKELYHLLFSGSPLRTFTETYSASVNPIPLDSFSPSFEYLIACTVQHENIYKDVVITDVADAQYRKSKMDGMLLYEQPIISLYSDDLRILPNDITENIELIYLRLPATPFYDYYVSIATAKVYYLKPGWIYRTSGPTGIIKDKDGVTVATGVSCPNNVTYADIYLSNSVELEWKTSYHPEIIKRILVKAGVTIRDEFIVQTQR